MPDPRAIVAAANRPKPPLAKDARLALNAWEEHRTQVAAMHAGARAALDALPSDNPWLAKHKANLEQRLDYDERQAHYSSISSFLTFLVEKGVVATYPNHLHRHLASLTASQATTALVDWLTTQLAGRSIDQIATSQLKQQLQQAITGATLSRSRLTLTNFVTVHRVEGADGRRGYDYLHDRSEWNLKLLACALNRLQTGQTDEPAELSRRLHAFLHYNGDDRRSLSLVMGTHLPKSPQIRINRNGTVEITFDTEASAHAFVTLYRLQSIEPTPGARKRERKEPQS